MASKKQVEKWATALRSWEEGLARLGESIVGFQRIEDILAFCISAMIGRSRKLGEIITCEMSFRAKLSTFAALFAHLHHEKKLPKDITELISRLHWAEQERNRIAHSLWEANEQQPTTILRSKRAIRKKLYSVDEELYMPEDLEELCKLFEGICTDFLYLTGEHLPKLSDRLRR